MKGRTGVLFTNARHTYDTTSVVLCRSYDTTYSRNRS